MTVRFNTTMTLDGRVLGPGQPPYIIAELSANHGGHLDRAVAVIDAAKDAGADAVKLQTYTADTMTIDHDGPGFTIEAGLWAGRKLHELYREAQTPWDWHPALFARGRERGITVFSTPFDETAVDLLEDLGAPAYKIASFEAVDLPLIRRCAATGKPLIISTGMADEVEIAEAVAAARDAGCRDLVLLHCVSAYPAAPEDSDLRTIPALAQRFGVLAGLSDHTLGATTAIAATALGATVIEKHVTLARADGGPDAAFSLEPPELADLCHQVRTAHGALGQGHFGRKPSEATMAPFRRSLYVVADIPAGTPLSRRNVRAIRPGHGLAPKHLEAVLGRRAARDLARGTPLDWSDLAPAGD